LHRVYVLYGHQPENMARTIMEKMDIRRDLECLGTDNPLIGIKPNLVVAQPADWGATTSPHLVRGVIEYLCSNGFERLVILESSWVGDSTKKAFQVCGYEELADEFNLPLVDLKEDDYQEIAVQGMNIKVCRKVLEVDYLINMPVLKAHCQTGITCALKNLKGCIPDEEKRRFHRSDLHYSIACLSKIIPSNLVIVDGIIGDLTHEEGGNPVLMGRVIAGRNPLFCDIYAAELLGYAPEQIKYIKYAAELGLGPLKLTADQVVELNCNLEAPVISNIIPGQEVDYLGQWVCADQACSPCYGSLIHALARFKERGLLDQLPKKLFVGQSFKGRKMQGVGIGSCTSGCAEYLPGCPPRAREIVSFLEELIPIRKGSV
jgi:uncharacterized protein (DUF362 family)